MRTRSWMVGVSALVVGTALFVAGCNQQTDNNQQAKNKTDPKKTETGGQQEEGHGWWCEEHGVPENICSLCLSEKEVQAKFKAKGDWCEMHDRAKSQCFKCDPSKYAKFEAMYKDKYGKAPPKPPKEEFEK